MIKTVPLQMLQYKFPKAKGICKDIKGLVIVRENSRCGCKPNGNTKCSTFNVIKMITESLKCLRRCILPANYTSDQNHKIPGKSSKS